MELVKPADPAIVAVLRAVDGAAKTLGHEYCLVGATARDLLLVNALGLRPGRRTRDLDFGLALETWDQFTAFKESMVAGGRFRADRRAAQRVYYADAKGAWELPVDLIPFGPIASADGEIAWPPSRDVVLNVAGFDDALHSSVRIEIDRDLIVRVASLPGLTILKLFAWGDRGRENSKDASDLYTLLSTYADAGNLDRLYEEEADLLETADFDLVLAGAQLLGRDVARVCDGRSLNRLEGILDRAELVSQMNRVCDIFDEHPERSQILVDRFRRGMAEGRAT